jgi:uncharacterized protein with HEPN domain
MRKRDDSGRLQDILDAINRIEFHLRGGNELEFAEDWTRQDAIVHQIEIIGEASRNVSLEFQERHPEIPWSQIIGMRNKIAHDYSDVDVQEIWRTATRDIPQLKQAIAKLIGE